MDIRRKHRSDCEHVNVIRTSRVLSPDRTWPDRWLSEMHESRKVGLGTTVDSRQFPSNVHINILRGLPCRLESLRLKFTNEPSIFVDGDLDESIKRSASDRLGDLVPQVRARTSPGVFRDMALLGLCLELSFKENFISNYVCPHVVIRSTGHEQHQLIRCSSDRFRGPH